MLALKSQEPSVLSANLELAQSLDCLDSVETSIILDVSAVGDSFTDSAIVFLLTTVAFATFAFLVGTAIELTFLALHDFDARCVLDIFPIYKSATLAVPYQRI